MDAILEFVSVVVIARLIVVKEFSSVKILVSAPRKNVALIVASSFYSFVDRWLDRG